MTRRRNAGSSTQNHLARHKLAVVFAEGPRQWFVTRIARVSAGGPLPAVAEELVKAIAGCNCGMESAGVEQVPVNRTDSRDVFPFRFCRKAAASPACEGIGLKQTHVAYRCIEQCGNWMPTSQGEDAPAAAVRSVAFPIE